MVSVKDLAHISNDVYDIDKNDYTGEKSGSWKLDWNYIVAGTGFKAGLYRKGDERVIAFSGSDDILDWANNTDLLANNVPAEGKEAINFFKKVNNIKLDGYENLRDIYARKPATPTYDITLTGHSLGGALAAIVGNKYGTYTVTFNSPGTRSLRSTHYEYHSNPYSLIGIETTIQLTDAADGKIHHYLIEGDMASHTRDHLGEKHWAKSDLDLKFPSLTIFQELYKKYKMHAIEQWLRDYLYDSNGNYYEPNSGLTEAEIGQLRENAANLFRQGMY